MDGNLLGCLGGPEEGIYYKPLGNNRAQSLWNRVAFWQSSDIPVGLYKWGLGQALEAGHYFHYRQILSNLTMEIFQMGKDYHVDIMKVEERKPAIDMVIEWEEQGHINLGHCVFGLTVTERNMSERKTCIINVFPPAVPRGSSGMHACFWVSCLDCNKLGFGEVWTSGGEDSSFCSREVPLLLDIVVIADHIFSRHHKQQQRESLSRCSWYQRVSPVYMHSILCGGAG